MAGSTVAILHYSGPPGIGGVEATIAAHARLLADDGHAVRIIVGAGAPTDPRFDLRLIGQLGSRHPLVETVNAELGRGECSATFAQLVNELTATLVDELTGCDVAMVHNIHTLHKNLAFTAALARLHQRGQAPRMLAWAHDFAWFDPLYLPQLHEGWPWSLLREPWPGVQYVAVSRDRQRILADLFQTALEDIAVVSPGVDVAGLLKLEPETQRLVQQHRGLEADPLLLLPARVTRRKNIQFAVQIAAALREHMPAPLLIVTGPPGPHNPTNAAYLAELQRLRIELQAPVLFLYEVFQNEDGTPRPVSDVMVADWLNLADGLLFPSKAEGFGMPVIEAALRGIPIFCSNIPPFREIAGSNALFFDLHEHAEDVAERIAGALRDDSRYQLRRHVRQRYTWQAIYERDIRPLLGL